MNRAIQHLRQRFPGRGGTARLARLIEKNPATVGRWLREQRDPTGSMRSLIEARTGTPSRWWDEPPSEQVA